MVDGEDDLFMTAPSGGLVYPGGEDYQEYQEQDGGSSSSGCEPDLVGVRTGIYRLRWSLGPTSGFLIRSGF